MTQQMIADLWPYAVLVVGAIATAIAGYLAKLSASWVKAQNEHVVVQNEEIWDTMINTAIHHGIAYAIDTEERNVVAATTKYVQSHVPGALKARGVTDEILFEKITARVALHRRARHDHGDLRASGAGERT